jgi:hypothetical protein
MTILHLVRHDETEWSEAGPASTRPSRTWTSRTAAWAADAVTTCEARQAPHPPSGGTHAGAPSAASCLFLSVWC